jgi:hypothetical protein
MPQAAPSLVASLAAFDSLPYRIAHKSSRICALLLLALLAAMACMVIVPLALVLVHAAGDVGDALAHKPLAAGALAVGLAAWIALLAAAAAGVLRRCWRRRSVTVTPERVVVCDAGLFGATLWTRPLPEFRGIAHHVRATLTGVRHELVLVHSARNRSVLLYAADSLSQATIDRAATLLRLPQVPARELYRLTRAGPAGIAALPQAAQAA